MRAGKNRQELADYLLGYYGMSFFLRLLTPKQGGFAMCRCLLLSSQKPNHMLDIILMTHILSTCELTPVTDACRFKRVR